MAGRGGRPATPELLLLLFGRTSGAHLLGESAFALERYVRLDQLIGPLTDSLDQQEVFFRREAAVLLAKIDDPLGNRRANPGQQAQGAPVYRVSIGRVME